MHIFCKIFGHNWDYFTLWHINGEPQNHRCCLRCEHTERTERLVHYNADITTMEDSKAQLAFADLSAEERVALIRQHYYTDKKVALTCKSCGQQVAVGWLDKHIQTCRLLHKGV